ncbi:MAG: thiamine phosphate synthase [Candidatus Omnitrophota bacterium]
MKRKQEKALIGYYFITDAEFSRRGNLSDVKNAVLAGVRFIQYRSKGSCARRMCAEAVKLRRLCRNATFLVNDRVDVALASGADGVHLGQDDFPCVLARRVLGRKAIIGVTVHNLKEAKKAETEGADYVAASPIFFTTTKKDAARPVGVGLIGELKRHLCIPLVAVGGINLSNAKEVVAAGADGLCAVSAVVASSNVRSQIRRFQELFK